MSTRPKLIIKQSLVKLIVGVMLISSVLLPQAAKAGMTTRSLTLTSSASGAAGVSYTFAFDPDLTTTIKSVRIDICDTVAGTCTPAGTGVPSGFVSTTGAVGTISGIGSGGSWTGTFTTNGRIDLANNSNTGAPGSVSVQITNLTNPSANNTSFYARMTTYSDSAWTTALDSGTVVASTAYQIQVSASVNETLTFCTGSSGITTSSCAGAANSTVDLGTLSTSSTGTGTSQIGVSTNATTGYSISINGSIPMSGGNGINAMTGVDDQSQVGTEQFGINLVDNATPNVGSAPDGSGSGAPVESYDDIDRFHFTSGTPVASKGSSESFRRYTVSYIANIAGDTPAGTYTGTYTYICTATF